MANITTQTIRVDLSTDKVLPTAFTHQNDTARTLEFSMYNKGMPYTMTGNTVKFAYKSPIVDGQYSVIAGSSMASGTVSGNKVTVTLPSAYTQISGVGMLTMVITPTSGTVRPVNIRLVVQKSADGDDEIAGASDFPATLQQIADEWYDENIANWLNENIANWLNENIESVYDAEAFGTAIDSWLDDHPGATTTVQDGSVTEAKLHDGAVTYNKLHNSIKAFVTPEMFGAVGDGTTDDTQAIQSALTQSTAVYLSKVYAISNTITLSEGVSLFGDGSLKYTGASTNNYFVTTYASGTTWTDIAPRDLQQQINIDCNGNANGIYFSGGLHNSIAANVRNAKGTGYFVASGHGYENSHTVSVMNDDNSIYADSIGVNCDKSDEVFENIFTRNCNVGCKMSGSGLIKNIHSWIYGDNAYPNSTTVQFHNGHVTVQYLYADTMQYPVTFDGLYKRIYIGSMECHHNASAVSSATVTANPFRPWRAKEQPQIGEMPDVTIGKIVFPTINNLIQNKLNPLQPFDGFVTITAFCNLLVYGKTIHIPNCNCYIPSNALTDVPSSGYNNNYKTAHVFANDHYKIIELINDYPPTDPMVKVQVNLTTWVAKWMMIAKEAIATVNPS